MKAKVIAAIVGLVLFLVAEVFQFAVTTLAWGVGPAAMGQLYLGILDGMGIAALGMFVWILLQGREER